MKYELGNLMAEDPQQETINLLTYRLNAVTIERDEWKAKFIKQNKDLGCEMMDPNGTIWDYAKKLQSELAAVTEQLKAAHDGWHDEITKGLTELRRAESLYTKAQERAERAEEQRDRLAEALKDALYDLETSDGLMACDNEEGHSLFCLEQRSIPKARQAIQSLNQPTP